MSVVDLTFKFCNFKPVSVNDAYVPTARKRKKYGGGFGGAFLRKSDALRNWQDKIQKSFDDEFFYTKDYLSTLASWINGMKLGLCYDNCMSESFCHDGYDISVDKVFTDKDIYTINTKERK